MNISLQCYLLSKIFLITRESYMYPTVSMRLGESQKEVHCTWCTVQQDSGYTPAISFHQTKNKIKSYILKIYIVWTLYLLFKEGCWDVVEYAK